jgi:hypothetical protein
MVGISQPECSKRFSWGRFSQRTPGFQIGQEYLLSGTQNFCGFGHKMYTDENNDICMGGSRLLRQSQAVSYVIGNFLQFRIHIIVTENDRILFLPHSVDFTDKPDFRTNRFINIPLLFK